jgi:hypothetical protein
MYKKKLLLIFPTCPISIGLVAVSFRWMKPQFRFLRKREKQQRANHICGCSEVAHRITGV